MSNQPVYKIIFHNGKQVFEVFAKHIYQSDMWGFVEIEEIIFGERSAILVDPGEEKLKSEFSGVKRSYIPMQSIVRIDEVEKQGMSEGSGPPDISSLRVGTLLVDDRTHTTKPRLTTANGGRRRSHRPRGRLIPSAWTSSTTP